jgi:protocatechuate 3,4-dioxygenase beta subunit
LDLCEELTHWVTIQAAGYGLQTVVLRATADKLDMTLGKVGRIQGRLTGLKSWPEPFPIFVRSRRPAPPETSQAVAGSAEAKTNDQGEFEIPEILAGEVEISVALPPDSRLRHQQTTVTLPAGQTATVEIEMAVANRLVGTVRDRETKQPVAGVSMYAYSPRWGGRSATTDENGKYSVQVPPDAFELEIMSVPSPYLRSSTTRRRVTIGEDFQDGQELPDALYELERGVSVSGRVQDPQGKPVGEAEVLATWIYQEGTGFSSRTTQATSDLQGEFVLTDVSRNTTLRVTARAETAGTLEPVEVAAAATEPLMLTVAPEGVVRLSGRVVDEQGGGVAGAQLQVRVQQQDEHGRIRSSSLVEIPGGLTTDEAGWFHVPQTLLRSADVQLEARAEGFLTATAAVTLPIADEPEFTAPEIVLKRVGACTGGWWTAKGTRCQG